MRKQSNEPSMASYVLINRIGDYVVKRPKVLEHYVGKPKQFIEDFNINGDNVKLGLKKIAKLMIKNKKSSEEKLKFLVEVASFRKSIISDTFFRELCLEFEKKSR